MLQARRSLAVLLTAAGASMSAGAGYMYLGQDSHAAPPSGALSNHHKQANDAEETPVTTAPGRRRPLRATSKKELGWEQSLMRDLACWISSASVYTATQVFYATAPSSVELLKRITAATKLDEEEEAHHRLLMDGQIDATMPSDGVPLSATSGMYHNLIGWIHHLDPQAASWNANEVIHSSSFSLLLNIVSGIDNLSLRQDLEQEIYQAVGLLATNAQCANAIVQRATRYGKHALLNMAQAHDLDPRMGEALSRMVTANATKKDSSFGPANLMSLLALAVADDIPDQYLQFALWGLSKAAYPGSRSKTYEWRKTLFGDDSTAKTRRKLVANDRLWNVLAKIRSRPVQVQLEAARLLGELSEEPAQIAPKMKRHLGTLDSVVQWINSDDPALACAALRVVANVASDRGLRNQLFALDAVDNIRARVMRDHKQNPQLVAGLLQAIRCLAESSGSNDGFILDRDSLSFVHESDDKEDPLHHDDFVHPNAARKHRYVDGWIELFTTFLRSGDDAVRSEAALCLEQVANHGIHQDQGIQEWLLAVLDGVLEQVPVAIAVSSNSVRAAKSRTRPLVGRSSNPNDFAASHAKALRALAFVAGRKECQAELSKRGGVALLKALLASNNLNVQRETARVLANLFTCDDMDKAVAEFARDDGELTAVLDAWTTSNDMMLRSLAHRARSNRRYQHDRLQHAEKSDVKYLDGVHPLHFSTSPAFNNGNQDSNSDEDSSNDYDVDVVFIHGLLGCPYETWICGEDESTVWAEQWLLDDMKREGRKPRILSIGYDSQLLASESSWRTMTLKETSQDILEKLQAARVGTSTRPVVFVTHSLGGVVLKQVLLESAENETVASEGDVPGSLLDNVNGVVFYGVPHHGSPVAQVIQALRPRTLGIEQHPVTEHLHGTPHLKMLNDWCAAVFQEKAIPALSIGESVPCRLPLIGVDALVVPEASANPGFGEFHSVENATHIDVCKPSSKEDVRYTLTKNFIARVTPLNAGDDMLHVE